MHSGGALGVVEIVVEVGSSSCVGLKPKAARSRDPRRDTARCNKSITSDSSVLRAVRDTVKPSTKHVACNATLSLSITVTKDRGTSRSSVAARVRRSKASSVPVASGPTTRVPSVWASRGLAAAMGNVGSTSRLTSRPTVAIVDGRPATSGAADGAHLHQCPPHAGLLLGLECSRRAASTTRRRSPPGPARSSATSSTRGRPTSSSWSPPPPAPSTTPPPPTRAGPSPPSWPPSRASTRPAPTGPSATSRPCAATTPARPSSWPTSRATRTPSTPASSPSPPPSPVTPTPSTCGWAARPRSSARSAPRSRRTWPGPSRWPSRSPCSCW